MKRTKKLLLKLAGMVMLFMMCMGIENTARAQTTVVPPMVEVSSNIKGGKSYRVKFEGESALMIPMSVAKPGKVCLKISGNTKKVSMIISSKAALPATGGWTEISPGSTDDEVSAYIKKKGTYYIHAICDDENSHMSFKIKAYEIPVSIGNAGTLSKGKWVNTSGAGQGCDGSEESRPAYFKIKAPSSGCVKVEVKTIGKKKSYIDFELTNSKKKRLMSNEIDLGITSYYGVKKGTYYAKVDTDVPYKIRYTFEKVAEKKNTTKKKAVSLKPKKTVKGVFTIDKKESNWYKAKHHFYKIKLKKPQTLKLTLTAKTNREFSYRVMESDSYKYLPCGKKQFKKKLKAGTYYLDIFTQSSTGNYSIRWN